MTDIKGSLLLWFTIFFDKKSAGSGVNTLANNEKLAEELHKPIIKKNSLKSFFGFKDNIWGADLADMQLIISFIKNFYCVLLIFLVNILVLLLRKIKKG